MDTDVKENLFFSPQTLGFYSAEMEKPGDAVEVLPQVESFLREVIVWGADKFTVTLENAEVEYPPELLEYVTQYDAPTSFSVQ